MLRWLMVWFLVFPLCAQGADWIREHYTKQEVMVPMRDGVRLFTSIYAPKDTAKAYPFLINRTPYSVAPYGAEALRTQLGPSEAFAKEGFIFVYQDVRGRFMSEGEFVDLRPMARGNEIDEGTDAFDTVAWLLSHQPGNNGKAGQWGISYPGFYAAAAALRAHPALVAVSPQAPCMDWFGGDDFHRNGAFWLPHLFNFISGFGQVRKGPTSQWPKPFQYGTQDGYDFFLKMGPLSNANAKYFQDQIPFWNTVMAHGTRDAYWQVRDLRPHVKAVRPAVLVVGGWFDAENLWGSLQLFKTLGRQSPNTPLNFVMGPWFHGGWERSPGDRLGIAEFGSPTSETFMVQVELPFFRHHLKNYSDPHLSPVTAFETGRNQWLHMAAWPPKAAAHRFFLQAPGSLGDKAGSGAEAFLSDPSNPVPFSETLTVGMPREYMTADQRFTATRKDVLTYQTGPLNEDLRVQGPVQVHLRVSTTGTDADWVVKVIDVRPDGAWMLVRGEVMRGKFRTGLDRVVPFQPGVPTSVDFSLNDICHAFLKGHRLMVQVQSSWFPLMDRNPQTFTDIYAAKAEDFRAATHQVFHDSYAEFPVVN